jgi:hypothetical protein
LESHWRRLSRALEHAHALDSAICRWLNEDSCRVVREHDPERGRTAYVLRHDPIPSHWADLVGEAFHNMRSGLDHLALALNRKGYAERNGGTALPSDAEAASEFPIFGNKNTKGDPIDGAKAFRSAARRYRNMPTGAQELIRDLQPFHAGADFEGNRLWPVHELNGIDKHRIDLAVSATIPKQLYKVQFDFVTEMALGAGGPMYDGEELCHWVIPPGAKEPDVDLYFPRAVAFGKGTMLAGAPVVPAIREIANTIRFKVAFPLDRFL